MVFKEETIPSYTDKILSAWEPRWRSFRALVMLPSCPSDPTITLLGRTITMGIRISSGAAVRAGDGVWDVWIILGGWASNNNTRCFGALRTSAQMLAYDCDGLLLLANRVGHRTRLA